MFSFPVEPLESRNRAEQIRCGTGMCAFHVDLPGTTKAADRSNRPDGAPLIPFDAEIQRYLVAVFSGEPAQNICSPTRKSLLDIMEQNMNKRHQEH